MGADAPPDGGAPGEALAPGLWEAVRRARPRAKSGPLAAAIAAEACARARLAPDEHGFGRLSAREAARLGGVSEALAGRVMRAACPGHYGNGTCVAVPANCPGRG